jgi:hypothetical protein
MRQADMMELIATDTSAHQQLLTGITEVERDATDIAELLHELVARHEALIDIMAPAMCDECLGTGQDDYAQLCDSCAGEGVLYDHLVPVPVIADRSILDDMRSRVKERALLKARYTTEHPRTVRDFWLSG